MKLLLALILLACIGSFAQETRLGISTKYMDSGNIYNKKTGEKIGNEELRKITEQYPGIVFEQVYNKYGEIEKLYFDPDNIHVGPYYRTDANKKKPGEKAIDFVFNTVDNEVIESDKLEGKWVLIQFEAFTRFINKDLIRNLGTQIEKLNTRENFIAIVCLAETDANVKSSFGEGAELFKWVSGCNNFHIMFGIIKTPVSMVIDHEGKVVNYYYHGDSLNLNELVRN